MYSNKLDEIQKEYASKHGFGLPLTPEQLLNAVVEWVNSNYIPSSSIEEISKEIENINNDIQSLESDKVSKAKVGFRVYATDINGDDIPQGQAYSSGADAYTIMQRDKNARTKVSAPEDSQDVANKEYVDNLAIYNEITGEKLLILGDSTAETNNEYKDWVYLISRYSKTLEVNNKAVGGTSPYQFLDGVTDEDINECDTCFIMGFFNGNTTVGEPGEAPESVNDSSTLCECYSYIISKLIKTNPDIKIIILSPHCPKAEDGEDRVKGIQSVCSYYRIKFIDVYNNCGFNSLNFSTMLRDSVHCSSAGYEYVARIILGSL